MSLFYSLHYWKLVVSHWPVGLFIVMVLMALGIFLNYRGQHGAYGGISYNVYQFWTNVKFKHFEYASLVYIVIFLALIPLQIHLAKASANENIISKLERCQSGFLFEPDSSCDAIAVLAKRRGLVAEKNDPWSHSKITPRELFTK